MKTKSNVRFFSRAAHLNVDLELADVVSRAIAKGTLSTGVNGLIFDDVILAQHPGLAGRANTETGRNSAASHLKVTLCEAFIKNIYEDMTQYFLEILRGAANNGFDSNRLIGEHKVTFESNDILLAGSWDKIVSMVAESVFRRLEGEKSTKELIRKFNTKLNLAASQEKIDAALPFLEIRHLLVHKDGCVDKAFCQAFPTFSGAVVGNKIKLDYALVQKTRTAIYELIVEFDERIVACNILARIELQP